MKEKAKRKNEKGITLIALVITIIVLLILAGVTITTLTGDNGILNKASKAKLETEYSEVRDAMVLTVSEYKLYKYEGEQLGYIEWLQGKGIIDSNNVINAEKLLGRNLSTGKGTGTTDVYKLEESTEIAKLGNIEGSIKVASTTEAEEYNLVYYNNAGEQKTLEILKISEAVEPEPTPADMFEWTESNGEISIRYIKIEEGMNEDKLYVIINNIKDIVIPKTIDGKNVVALQDFAFYTNNVETLIIPNTVRTIGDECFAYCKNLTKVKMSNSLTSIGNNAFNFCTGLTSITIPSSVTSIGNNAFYGCTGLTSITIPSSVTTIGNNAFSGCSNLTKITIEAGSSLEVNETTASNWGVDLSIIEKK